MIGWRSAWSRALSGRTLCLFNWNDTPATLSARLERTSQVTDFWSGEPLGRQSRTVTIEGMPAHSARLLVCEDA